MATDSIPCGAYELADCLEPVKPIICTNAVQGESLVVAINLKLVALVAELSKQSHKLISRTGTQQ